MKAWFEIKVRAVLGPDAMDDKESCPAIVTKNGASVRHVFLAFFAVLVFRHLPLVSAGAVTGTQQTQMNKGKAPIQIYMVYIYICIF